jgi:hypothetical protein
MAENLVYRNDDNKNRTEDLGLTLAPGTPVLSKAGLPAVTVNATADYTITKQLDDLYSDMDVTVTYNRGGASLQDREVTLAFDGTWEFPTAEITGVTAATAQGTAVYITSARKLTATATDNTLFGYVDYPPTYNRTRGFTPIRIGA